MENTSEFTARPWSARRPQSVILSAAMVLVAIGLVTQGIRYISEGTGGLVPFLIVLGAPALAIYYVWYFNFYRFDESPSSTS